MSLRLAARYVESCEMAQAVQNSLEQNQEEKVRMERAQGIVYNRLVSRGLRVIPTLAEGDCFFEALVRTAELATSPFHLRPQICDYIEQHVEWFESCFQDRAALVDHIQRMREAGTWATAFEITAASHLLLRPIHLVTDHVDIAHSTTVIEPLSFTAASAWGETVYLVHFLQWHFEGTVAA